MALMISPYEFNSPKGVWIGASVTGPAHKATGLSCQDAWAAVRWLNDQRQPVFCAAVCDGLGSRPMARLGAKAAIRVVKSAARQWGRAPGAPVGLLVRLIEVLWRLEVTPTPAQNCATTCQLALMVPEGESWRVVVCVLGDGLVVVETPGNFQVVGGRSTEAFGNETIGLGTAHHMDDWKTLDMKTAGGVRVLLLSDGVSDDVPTERFAELVSWGAGFESRPLKARGPALRRALERWPVPNHHDDKTFVYMRVEEIGNR